MVCDPIAEESLPAVPESESVHESDMVGLFSVTVHEDAFSTRQKRRVVPPCCTSDGCACSSSSTVSAAAAAATAPVAALLHDRVGASIHNRAACTNVCRHTHILYDRLFAQSVGGDGRAARAVALNGAAAVHHPATVRRARTGCTLV